MNMKVFYSDIMEPNNRLTLKAKLNECELLGSVVILNDDDGCRR